MPEARSNHRMLNLIAAAATGIVFGYYLDPRAGRSRRIRLRDRLKKIIKNVLRHEQLAFKDLEHRAQGGLCAIRNGLRERTGVDESVLHDRIRAVLGHYCSHPHGIKVQVTQGKVMLSGELPQGEATALLTAVRRVRGVSGVLDYLIRHEDLAGTARENWPFGFRMAVGFSGLMMSLQGARRGGGVGWAASVCGALLLARSSLNMSLRKMLGIGVGPNVVAVQKTINVKAPVTAVYALWRTPERFPAFMHHVQAVDKLGNGRYRWVIRGPLGIAVPFVGDVTVQQENKKISWEGSPGTLIGHRGSIYFENHGEAATLHLNMHYNPPLGMLGHLVALLLHNDPKTKLDEDLARMKCMLETGKLPHGAARRIASQKTA